MLQKLARIFAVIYLVYLALSIVVVLPALNILAPQLVEENLGRPLSAKIIFYNPFLLSVEARQVQLPERDGSDFLSLSTASVNLSLASLWRQGWVLDAIVVQGLKLHIERLPAGDFNFSSMLNSSPEPQVIEPASPALPRVTIRELVFDAQYIDLADHARAVPFSTRYESLAIKINDLSTVIEEGKPYRISLEAEAGGKLKWIGEVSVPKSESSGALTLSNISLQTLSRFAEPWINFEIKEGRLEVAGSYTIQWAEALRYKVDGASVGITGVSLLPKDTAALPDTSIALESLNLGAISVDSNSSHVSAGDMIITGLNIAGWSEDQRISLKEMFIPSNSDTQTLSSAPTPKPKPNKQPEATAAANSQWTASLSNFQLIENQLHWRSAYTSPPQLAVNPINVQLENIAWPLEGASRVQLALTLNALTQVSVEGSLALAQGAGALTYRVNDLPLKWFNPNLPKALKATISDGNLTLSGAADLDDFNPTHLRMNGAIRDFSATVDDTQTALTSWEELRWDNFNAALDERKIDLERLSVHNYAGRIHIAKDGTVNAQRAWQKELNNSANETPESPELDEPWNINIPQIIITESAIDFMDESLPVPFRTEIGDFSGEIRDISSAKDSIASVEFAGTVDGYAPVSLTGTANPLLPKPALDLNLTFDGIDMALLTPYSGVFAGRAIKRGVLSLDLNYSLKENKLKGTNSIVMKQFKFGENVASDKAVDLPLDLALALLTDTSGVIDLSVPISGDVDSPKFSIGGILGGALLNVITKAIASPFSLLANLVGSEADLHIVNFPAGSSELSKAGIEKLVQLNDALHSRPNLTLLITGRLNMTTDRTKMQTAALHTLLRNEQGLSKKSIATRSPEYAEAITNRYLALSSEGTAQTSQGLQLTQVLQSIAISDQQLLQLAQARAEQIEQYLVNELGLEAKRTAIASGNLDPVENQISGVELGLQL